MEVEVVEIDEVEFVLEVEVESSTTVEVFEGVNVVVKVVCVCGVYTCFRQK